VHLLRPDDALRLADEAGSALRVAQEALEPYPSLVASGPLHDAAKEYA
jgi:predicted translin family RNA/ssDNA-binding protein